jgi:flagellar biosynthesis protein FlhB
MSDKTEEPTPRRLAKAREKGDVGVSSFASQALGFLVAVLLVPGAVAATAAHASAMLQGALHGGSWSSMELAREVVVLTAPLLLAVAATSALATLVQTGALFAPRRMAPDLGKLDLLAGLRSLVNGQRLWSVVRALLASLAVGWLAFSVLRAHAADLAHTVGTTGPAAAVAARAAGRVARGAAFVAIAFALVDLLVTRRAFLAKLRMTKAEVKREHRESEGDPQLKAARHRAHQEMLAAATVNAVREATVVIVNPQHLATALRYVEGEDEAPRVVATADGELARRIQEAARAYGIPIVRDVPVARALSELEVGDSIPEALYEAVAEILREVWSAEGVEPGSASATTAPSRPPAT